MRGQTITEATYNQVKQLLDLNIKGIMVADITKLSSTTVSRINTANSYTEYVESQKAKQAVSVDKTANQDKQGAPVEADKLDTIIELLRQMIDIWTTQDRMPELPKRGLFGVKKVDVNERQ